MTDESTNEFVCSLPASTEAPAMARRYLHEHATGLSPALLDDAEIVVSEIVTNAVLHGQPDITLRLKLRPPSVGVSVHDYGASNLPNPDRPDETDPHGRGLLIATTLASAWGIDHHDGAGKTVWFEVHPAGD